MAKDCMRLAAGGNDGEQRVRLLAPPGPRGGGRAAGTWARSGTESVLAEQRGF